MARLAEVGWRELRGALILLLVSLIISGGLTGSSYRYWYKMDQAYKRERAALLAARSQYQNIDEEDKLIEDYFPRYRELEAAGIIGSEQRLDWIDTLRKAAQSVDVPSLRYVIDSQELYRPDFPLPENDFNLYASTMTLDLGLLHEGDLPALLEDLNQNATGFYTVDECEMNRVQEEFIKAPDAINLTATCDLRWITIRPAQPPSL